MRMIGPLLFMMGCSNSTKFDGLEIEEGTIVECTEELNAFDIEDVSTLQDAMSNVNGNCLRDAVIIDFGGQGLASDTRWRVSAVDILIMIPEEKVSSFQDGNLMRVEVFDSDDPTQVEPYILEMEVNRVDLQWTLYTLPEDAAHAGENGEYRQYGAWLKFDFLDIIPTTGMISRRFVVSVAWPEPGNIAVGYSNFNRSCAANWTDYGEGWVLEQTYPGSCEE
jgi:hypothetical protein